MPGEQDVGNRPSAVIGGARVVRIFGRATERRAERLLGCRVLVPKGAGLLAQDGVADDHRRELTSGQYVTPDRQPVSREILEDALVKTLVTPAQERERRLCRELVDERIVQHPPAWRQ